MTLDSPLLGDDSPLDARQKSVIAALTEKERAFVASLPTDDPLDPHRRRRVEATRGEMFAQPQAIEATWTRNIDALETISDRIASRVTDRIFLVGAGDSLAVMIAARRAMERMTGVACEPVESLEFAYYSAHLVTRNSLVMTLSSSGETTRTAEAALVAQNAGAFTVALTNTPGSTLARESETTLVIEATRVGWPTQSSTAALALLLRLAALVGVRRAEPDAEDLLRELQSVPGLMAQVLQDLDEPIAEICRAEADRTTYLFSAGGPNWAAAIVGAAKVKETTPDHASEIQIEEFQHYNSIKPGEPLFVFAPSGPSVPRAAETGRETLRYGGRLYYFTSETEHALDSIGGTVLRLPAIEEVLSPLLYLLPAQLVGYHSGMAKFAVAEAATHA